MFKQRLRTIFFSTITLFIGAGISNAQSLDAIYIDIGAGVSMTSDLEGTPDTTNLALFDFGFDAEVGATGAVGVRLGENWRAELELGYAESDVDGGPTPVSARGVTYARIDTTGDVSVTTLMLNVLYALPVAGSTNVVVGGGIGWAHLDIDLQRGAGQPGFILQKGMDDRFAYQARIGVESELLPQTMLYANYNYLDTAGDAYQGFNTSAGSTRQTLDYSNHTMKFGLRYRFGQ